MSHTALTRVHLCSARGHSSGGDVEKGGGGGEAMIYRGSSQRIPPCLNPPDAIRVNEMLSARAQQGLNLGLDSSISKGVA